MVKRDEVRILRGTKAAVAAATLLSGELAFDTEDQVVFVGDGATAGGILLGPTHNFLPGQHSGRRYAPGTVATWNTATVGTTVISYQPVCVGKKGVLTSLSFYVAGAGAGGSTARVAIYRNGTGQPTTLLQESGTLATSSTGLKTYTLSPSLTLSPGWYWLGFQTSSATPTYTTHNPAGAVPLLGWNGVGVPAAITAYFQIQAYGAFPATATINSSQATNAIPVVWLGA